MHITKSLKTFAVAVAAVPMLASCLSDGNSYAGIFGIGANSGKPVYANTAYSFVSFGSYRSWHIEQTAGGDWCRLDMTKGSGGAYFSIPAWFDLNTTGKARNVSYIVRDDQDGDDVYGTFSFVQRATRIDGSLGSAALVTGIEGDDGSSVAVEYDTLCRPVDVTIKKDGAVLRHVSVEYTYDDNGYYMTAGGMTADCDFDYRPRRLTSETDTVGYYEQSYITDRTWDAFNVEERKSGGERIAQALLFTTGSIRNLDPDSEQSADSLRYRHYEADGTVYGEDLKLSYSKNSNRLQSVDANQLLLGIEECSPYMLISLFPEARNSYIISEAAAADGKIAVATTLNADGSVATMAVTNKQGQTVNYTFTYSSELP